MKSLFAFLFIILAATCAHAQTTNRFAATIFRALTNDVVITNQTNMTTVTDLSVSIEPNKKYSVQLLPLLSAANNSTALQVVASNATVYGLWDGITTSSYTTNPMTNENSFVITTQRAPWQVFYAVGGTNAGSITIQFRSTVATNTNTFHTGSFIRADKLPQ